MSTTFQIVTEGRVYIYSRREFPFEVAIHKAHDALQGESKASTFDALHDLIAEKWLLRDDVVKSFGIWLENLRFVCTFDLDRDLFSYSDVGGHIQLPLARLREPYSSPPQRSEFISIEMKSPPQLDLAQFPPPHHKPSMPITKRRLDLSSHFTLWRTAKAIISIATCDFQVDEIFTKHHTYLRGAYVTPLDVPHWEPYETPFFSIGDTRVILHQDLKIAMKTAKDEAKKINVNPGDRTAQQTYLLLSVRHMVICHVNATGTFSYTAPTILIDGLTLPSPTAIALLLQALPPSRPPPCTPIHKLPLELQDRILEQVSRGPVEAARLGCLLGLGSSFTWMRSIDWPRRGGLVELFTSPSRRWEFVPVEAQIYFGNVFSGVSYR